MNDTTDDNDLPVDADFSHCRGHVDLTEELKRAAEQLAEQHREETPDEYDDPQHVLKHPKDEELAEKQRAEIEAVLDTVCKRADAVLQGEERIRQQPFGETYEMAFGDYYADAW